MDVADGGDARHQVCGDSEQLELCLVPAQRGEIHQLRAAGVGHVRDVYTASLSSGELPHQIAVDIPEEEVSGFGELSGARGVVQNAPHLQTAAVTSKGHATQL